MEGSPHIQPEEPYRSGSNDFAGTLRAGIRTQLFRLIDIAPLVYFRILFGSIMLWEVTRYYSHDWIERYYIDPAFFFSYYGFSWIQPWGGNLMYVHFLFLGILAVFIIVGLWYRVSATLFFLGFTYVFLLDQANYLNHFYLVSWVSFLMIFVPAHRAASLDVVRHPEWRVSTVPAWPQILICTIIGIAYFFGGIAKINSDWLRGEPMRMWLAGRTDFPVIGTYFSEEWAAYLFSYGGLLFDLLIVPMLVWRKTRIIGAVLATAFHLTNFELFTIGIFPWFMLLATPMFFDPKRLRFVLDFEKLFGKPIPSKDALTVTNRQRRWVPVFVGLFAAYHVFMPLRHHLYPGNVSWTEEGHNWSWHMKLRNKLGDIRITVTDPQTDESWLVEPRQFLSSRQERKMKTRPDMIVQFCHFLEEHYQTEGIDDVEIHVESMVSLNGRPPQPMIDPEVDLTEVRRSVRPADWILPLEIPLRNR